MDNYIGQVMSFGGNFAPVGWKFCDGSLLQISQYQALFTLIGTAYGGDGVNTFALPDLRGRLPVGQGQGPGLSNYPLGSAAGVEAVALTQAQAVHAHPLNAVNTPGTTPNPGNGVTIAAVTGGATAYTSPSASDIKKEPLNTAVVSNTGSGVAHSNMMPTLGVSYVIAYQGIFPSQN